MCEWLRRCDDEHVAGGGLTVVRSRAEAFAGSKGAVGVGVGRCERQASQCKKIGRRRKKREREREREREKQL